MDSVALAYEPLLRHLDGLAGPPAHFKALAATVDKDPSNMRRDLPKLAPYLTLDDRGVPTGLTMAGRRFLMAMDVAEGRLHLLDGFAGVRHGEIAPHPLNPRKRFDEEALDELSADIVATGYVIQNLLIRLPVEGDPDLPEGARFWLVAGERRWRAVGLAIKRGQWDPETLLPAQVRSMTKGEHLRLALAENIQREGLNPIEQATIFEELISSGEETSISLAARLNKTDRYIDRRRQLLRCPPITKLELIEGKISIEQALKTVQAPRPGSGAGGPADAYRPTPKMALVIVEVAHFLDHPNSVNSRHQRWRRAWISHAAVPIGAAETLHREGDLLIENDAGGRRIALSGRAQQWLVTSGMDPRENPEALRKVREAVLSPAVVMELETKGHYASMFLNDPAVILGDRPGGDQGGPSYQSDLYRQIKDSCESDPVTSGQGPESAPLFAETPEEKAAVEAVARREEQDRLDDLAVSVHSAALRDLFAFNRGRHDIHWHDLEPEQIADQAVAAMADGSWWGVALLAALRCKVGHKALGELSAAMAKFAASASSRDGLVDLFPGDVVNTGGATDYRLIGRAEKQRFGGLQVQPILGGKDRGQPRIIWLWDIRKIVSRANASPAREAA